MKNKNYFFRSQKNGVSILGFIVLAFVVILVLSYFKVSIKSIVESPSGQENITYVKGGTESLWTAYFAKPASHIWNDVVVNIFWKGFISNMERIRDGKATDFDNAANNLQIQQ